MVILDLDDAFEGNDRMAMLRQIRSEVPGLRVTLFAIPGRCSPSWVNAMHREADWVDIVPHGWTHHSNRECTNWTQDQCKRALDDAEARGFRTRGFKAPGWQISDGCYVEFVRRGYWVADQPYNNARRPATLRTYLLEEPPDGVVQIHGHVGHLNGYNANELEYLVSKILQYRDSEFGFVRDVVG